MGWKSSEKVNYCYLGQHQVYEPVRYLDVKGAEMQTYQPEWFLEHAEHGNEPWPVQAEALRRMGDRTHYNWFLEMGLGKTSLALNKFCELIYADVADQMVVVCPYSFTGDWDGQPREWGVPWIASEVWSKRTEVACDQVPEGTIPRVVAVGFETAKTSARQWLRATLRKQRTFLVLDEGAIIGNPGSDITKFMIECSKDSVAAVNLNGTPYIGNVLNYWGQLRFARELNGVNPYAFKARYAKLGGYMGKQIKGIRNEEELMGIVNRCSFRATKAEWRKDMPPKTYQDILLDMAPRQKKAYRDMLEDFFAEVGDIGIKAPMVLTQLDKLRQISSCLAYQDGKHRWIVPPSDNPKLIATRSLVQANERKSIVVYNYDPSGRVLLETLNKDGMAPAMIRGQMSPAELIEQKRRFNNDPNCRAIVCQQSATFRGHTLIGSPGDRATLQVYYENAFSYYQRSQMEDRNHRGAQDETCHYVDLVCSPAEKKVVRAVRKVKATAAFLDGAMSAMQEEAW